MDGHLDVALVAGGHDGLQEVFEVVPQLLLGDGAILLKQLVQLGHPLRLPAREGHIVLLGETHDVIRHLLGVLFDLGRLVVQCGGAVSHRVEQVGAGPVKHGHKVVANYFYPKAGQIFDGLFVIFNERIPGWQANLDVIMDINGLHYIHIETVKEVKL